MAWQAAEPGIDGIDRLDHDGKVAALDDLLDQPQLLVGNARIFIPDDDGGRHIGLADRVSPEFLQREISIGRLVGGIAVNQRRGLVGHHLFQERGN